MNSCTCMCLRQSEFQTHCLLQVRSNIQAAKEALGIEHAQNQHKEDRVMHEVQEMLKPIKNMTWPSGRPENNTE